MNDDHRLPSPKPNDYRALEVQGVEIWRPVPNAKYEASNLGRLRNPKTGNIVGTHRNAAGYVTAPDILVHRAVLAAFDGDRPPNIVVRHKDNDRTNNALTNLEWGTRAENAADTAAAGRLRHRSGVATPLDPAAVEACLDRLQRREITQSQAAEELGRSGAWISNQLAKRVPSTQHATKSRLYTLDEARALARDKKEVWVEAPGFPGSEVSNLGRIRTKKTGRVRTISADKVGGYPRLVSTPVHRIVMTAFSDPPFDGALIRHAPDPDRMNNSVLNLEWGTYAENGADTRAQGRSLRGDNHPRAVLTQAKVEEGLRRFVDENWTTAQLGLFLGTGQGNASDIVNGKLWAHVNRPAALLNPVNRRSGGAHHLSHLTDERVRAALEQSSQEGWGASRFAKELGISVSTATQIRSGKTWRHIPRPPGTLPEPLPPAGGNATQSSALAAEVRAHLLRIESGAAWGPWSIILSRDQILRATEAEGREAIENLVLPGVLAFLRRYVELRGWFYPTCDETLDSVLQQLADTPPTLELSSKARIGNAYLQARFHSFWDVDQGPVKRFHEEKTLDSVVRYRLGLNNSKLYEYTLSDGRKVKAQETFDITLHNILRGFVVQHATVSFFKPQNAASIYRALLSGCSAPRVWDPSCGFGARLLGFAATFPDGTYFGCEPATQTRRDVLSLAEDLQHAVPDLRTHISSSGSEERQPFEDSSLDLVFTSPPYFDLEQYFDEPTQCWKRFDSRTSWVENFLVATFREAFRGLKSTHVMAINISNQYADDVRYAAGKVGFVENGSLTLQLGAGPFHRTPEREGRQEPVLLFVKP